MKPTILLFDIDGTLVSAGGAGRRAVVRIFAAHFARPEIFDGVRFHGMTDRAIIRGGLERLGLPADEAAIDALCAAYLAALAIEIPRSEGFRVLPGVPTLLETLAGRAHVAVGLGTGNLREGARIKLESALVAKLLEDVLLDSLVGSLRVDEVVMKDCLERLQGGPGLLSDRLYHRQRLRLSGRQPGL